MPEQKFIYDYHIQGGKLIGCVDLYVDSELMASCGFYVYGGVMEIGALEAGLLYSRAESRGLGTSVAREAQRFGIECARAEDVLVTRITFITGETNYGAKKVAERSRLYPTRSDQIAGSVHFGINLPRDMTQKVAEIYRLKNWRLDIPNIDVLLSSARWSGEKVYLNQPRRPSHMLEQKYSLDF